MAYTILVVDDEENARKPLEAMLTQKGYEVAMAGTVAETREKLQHGIGDVVLLDIELPDGSGTGLLSEISRMPSPPPAIMITAYPRIEYAIEALRNGAQDFFLKPLDFKELEQSIQRACELVAMRRELAHYRQMATAKNDFVAGNSPAMKALFERALRASKAAVSVLITGESGVGKEIMAQFIANNGPRAGKQFIEVNSAAIQDTMVESELFGYEQGAFTGAEKKKYGLMEVADGGILFLDEIAAMTPDMQAKLLRALEAKSIMRVGGTKSIPIDVQVLAASNRDLKAMIRDGKFREDLYYRLKFVDINVPPLRERKEDIPELVGYFIRAGNAHYGMNIQDVTGRALKALVDYDWPGNIRELRYAIETAMIYCDSDVIDINLLPPDVIKAHS